MVVFMGMLLEDIRRYHNNRLSLFGIMKLILLTQSIWAIIIYRMGSWCHCNRYKIWPRIVLPVITVLQKIVEIATGIVLPFTAQIGKGLYIGHFGSIIISPKAIIGEYCNLSHEVTIGQAGRGGIQNVPVVGNRVYFGPGAKVFGGINIGNDVAIGANAVVTKDLPDNAVAVGIPAKIINYKGSQDFIKS